MSEDEKIEELGLTEVQLDALKLRLSKWLLGFVVAFLAVGGGILTLVFKGIAKETAEQGVTQGVLRELRKDKDFTDLVAKQAAIPIGTVVAVDAPECPVGPWRLFGKGSGRVIVGAGAGNTDASGTQLQERRWTAGSGTTGGMERVALAVAEMPSHSHDVNDDGHAHGIRWGQPIAAGPNVHERSNVYNRDGQPQTENAKANITLESSGGGTAHNNMPPFLVLTLCERIRE